jgi:hypothetical protein
MAPAVETPAYCTDPTAKELPLLLKQTDREKAVRYRDKAMRIMAKLPSNYPAEQLVRVSRFSMGLDRLKAANWLAMLGFGVAVLWLDLNSNGLILGSPAS